MPRPPVNLAPAVLLTFVSVLFAVTWSHDRPRATASTCRPQSTDSALHHPLAYPAVTGLITSGRAALRGTLITALPVECGAARRVAFAASVEAASPESGEGRVIRLTEESSSDWLDRLRENARLQLRGVLR